MTGWRRDLNPYPARQVFQSYIRHKTTTGQIVFLALPQARQRAFGMLRAGMRDVAVQHRERRATRWRPCVVCGTRARGVG
jgi:hypothetical protein